MVQRENRVIFTDQLLGKPASLRCASRQRNNSTNATTSSRIDVIHCQNPRILWMVVSRKRYTAAKVAAMADQISESGLDDGPVCTSSVLHEQTESLASCADNPTGDVSQVALWIVVDHGVADGPTGNFIRLSMAKSSPDFADDVFGVEFVPQEPSSTVGAASAVDSKFCLRTDDTDP